MAEIIYKNNITVKPQDLIDYARLLHSTWDIEQIHESLQYELETWVEQLMEYWGCEYTSIEDDYLDTLRDEIDSYITVVYGVE